MTPTCIPGLFTLHRRNPLTGSRGILGVPSCDVFSLPLGRRDCLRKDARKYTPQECKSSSRQIARANPKQQALEFVFCFWGTRPPPPPSPDPTPPVSVPRVTLRVASALIQICWAPPSRRHSRHCYNKGFDSFQCYVCLWACSPVCKSRRYIYISLKEISRCCHQATVSNFQLQNPTSFTFYLFLNGPEQGGLASTFSTINPVG